MHIQVKAATLPQERERGGMGGQGSGDGPKRHPLNPQVVRGPNGIWDEDTLPVLGWEAPQHRVVLTPELEAALGLEQPVLRWPQRKRELVLARHPRDHSVIESLDVYLAGWKFAGREAGKISVWRALFESEGRWYSITFGYDQTGSLNLVTAFGGSQKSFLSNRLKGIVGVIAKSDLWPGGGSGIS